MNYFKGTDDYVISPDLRDNVNVAIALGRPLLVKGEPGTGKTLLAHSIAKGLGKKINIWNVKSTTKAREGLYVYDTVQRLNDARFGDNDISDIKQYIKLGKLGESFSADEQVVLLIDEIDKAEIEFPNDLLNELDEMSFYIPETGETIKAMQRPIVIITSNSEKELPDPFLRRCVFHFIDFPGTDLMEEIVKVHYPDIEKKLLREALKKFYWIREFDMLRKKPSTSELIDWLQALTVGGISHKKIEEEIPFIGTLLKKKEDIDLVEKSGKSHYAYNTSTRTRDVY
ncbi:MAG TPA: MoxR family ATPase [Spirochaetota bacterium]|nr:MoxR family ATPase [Spirochaetota bacterium]HRZ26217.1 MoxR family ATPase [Spirochaetota bacterium]HSA14651.1 MoxR family ATPase [Spirochaetota bacterium]